MIKATIVGLVRAVGRIAGTQKWFMWYIHQPCYHISVYQVSWKGTTVSIGPQKYHFAIKHSF